MLIIPPPPDLLAQQTATGPSIYGSSYGASLGIPTNNKLFAEAAAKANAAIDAEAARIIQNIAGKRSPQNTINFVYPSYLNNDNIAQDEETANLNFIMFFGMHLNNEKNGDVVICLPIPKTGLSDSLTANWKMDESLAETLISAGNSATTDQTAGTAASNIFRSVAKVIGSDQGLGYKPVDKLIQAKDNFFGNAQADTDIPIFSKMDNREHNFSWEFTPTSIDEANMITAICNTFKLGTLPHFKPGQTVLGFPPRWNIKTRFSRYGLDFKTSVIKSCTVSYGGGTYNEFQVTDSAQRGIPVKIILSLKFMEIARANTLLITDPNRQRRDRGPSREGHEDKWAQAKGYAGDTKVPDSVKNIVSTGFFDADTFSGNAEMLD